MDVKGKYVSVWDGGLEVKSECMINTDTMEVYSIEVSDVDTGSLKVLEGEFVEFANAPLFYPVGTKEEFKEGFVNYWRD